MFFYAVELIARVTVLRSTFQRVLQKQGLKFQLGAKVTGGQKQADGTHSITFEPVAGGKPEKVKTKVLASALEGR